MEQHRHHHRQSGLYRSDLEKPSRSCDICDVPNTHDHNFGYLCSCISRRFLIVAVAACFFVGYTVEVIGWVIFARDLADQDANPASHCYGIRCPSVFSCVYQHDTTLLVRYAIEVIFGIACALTGVVGAYGWNPRWTRVFGVYLAATAFLQLVFGGFDWIYCDVCEAYPANIVASMPVLSGVRGGRVHLSELHMVDTALVDEIFGYDTLYYYLWRTLAYFLLTIWVSYECFVLAWRYENGEMGLGPNFKLGDGFGDVHALHGDFRMDLKRMHGHNPVAGYGTLPQEPERAWYSALYRAPGI